MTHEQVVAEVIARARANPSQASLIFADASEYFNRLAEDPRRSEQAPLYQMMAKEFASQSGNRSMRRVTKNDFDEGADEYAQAYEASVGDDMEAEARRRDIHEDADPQDANAVSIVPQSIKVARIGNVVTLKYGATGETSEIITDVVDPATGLVTGQTVTQVQSSNSVMQETTALLWQGNKMEAQSVTIDIGVLAQAMQNTSARPYGIVTYGTDGITTSARFDIIAGTRFTVMGNYVSVLLGMEPPLQKFDEGGDPLDPPEYYDAGQMTFGASLAFFASPSVAPVTRTIYIDSLKTGKYSQLIPRPDKSTGILPPQSDLFGSLAAIYSIDSRGVGSVNDNLPNNTVYKDVFNFGNVITPIPLAGDVAYLQVFNDNDAGNIANIRLMFQLAL